MEPENITLPDYSPSTPAPDYSSRPLPGEMCIQKTPRRAPYYDGNCTFTYQEYGMSLTLRGCREESGMPAFGLCGTISGEFEPNDRDRILSIEVKLEGHVLLKRCTRTSSGLLFSKACTLWQKSTSTGICPSVLPISISFPATYRDSHDRALRLPPSVDVVQPRHAAISYSLHVTIRKSKKIFFSTRPVRELSMIAQLAYSPRVRPPRPVPTCFTALKYCPEEWQQEIWSMSQAMRSQNSPLLTAQCHFFLPSMRVFAISDTIPFHLSFSFSIAFLKSVAECIGSETGAVTSFDNPMHVFLLRQTTVYTTRCESTHEEVLGVGSTSPDITPVLDVASENSTVTMSWDGELCCETPITHTGFTTGAFEVKDFVVLSLIVPPGPIKSVHPQLRYAIPIRLVTHPWIDRS